MMMQSKIMAEFMLKIIEKKIIIYQMTSRVMVIAYNDGNGNGKTYKYIKHHRAHFTRE